MLQTESEDVFCVTNGRAVSKVYTRGPLNVREPFSAQLAINGSLTVPGSSPSLSLCARDGERWTLLRRSSWLARSVCGEMTALVSGQPSADADSRNYATERTQGAAVGTTENAVNFFREPSVDIASCYGKKI
jgi:hypothetical protein